MIKLNDLLKVLKMDMDVIFVFEDTREMFGGTTSDEGFDDDLVVLSISKLTINICYSRDYEKLIKLF